MQIANLYEKARGERYNSYFRDSVTFQLTIQFYSIVVRLIMIMVRRLIVGTPDNVNINIYFV